MQALYKFIKENEKINFFGKEKSLNARRMLNRKPYEFWLLLIFMLCFKLSNGQIKTNSATVGVCFEIKFANSPEQRV